MATLRNLIIFTLLSSATSATAFPCTKYTVDLGINAMPGNITISWSIHTGFNNCGFDKDEILKHRFIVTIENLFQELLVKDTIDDSFFRTTTRLTNNAPMIFSIEELGNSEHYYTYIVKPQQEEMPPMLSRIDSLNSYLVNGYFTNALSILHDMNRTDLIDEIIAQHRILFPDHYPRYDRYLNCYLDPETLTLIKMPFVSGLPLFIEGINKLSRKDPRRATGFKVYATISSENKVIDYKVIPSTDTDKFDKVAHLLTFNNHRNGSTDVVIKVGRSKNHKKFTIINERALMDQDSEYFRRTFPYRGALH
jgi:hypothetical protein